MPSPVKVLWLANGLGPGGTERLLVSLARTIDRSRFDLGVAYLLPEKDQLVGELADAGVRSVCLDGASAIGIGWTGRLRRLVAEQEFDIVHVQAPRAAALARPVLRWPPGPGRPVIGYTEHNSWDGYRLPTRLANAATYPLDDFRLAVSETALRSIPAPWRGRTEVLVHGVELDAVRSHGANRVHARRSLGVADGEVLVVAVANLRAHKDYPTLVAAARLVLSSGLPVRFVAVGQGPLESEVRQLIDEAGLGDSFRLLGYRADALDVLAAADIFTLSSIAEGYPVSLMEALALAKPVVATAVGGIPEAVRSGVEGLLVPSRDPVGLAEALQAMASDPARRDAMARAAGARAELFDIGRAAARHEEIYSQFAGRRVRR